MNFRDLAQSCYRYQLMSRIKNIYNQFNPFNPLPANDPAYVNCSEVRGDDNIFKEIGKAIIYSDKPTCHLYTGNRGAGKSTELLVSLIHN